MRVAEVGRDVGHIHLDPCWAARAALQASTKVEASPRSASATTSSRCAGFVVRREPPGPCPVGRPAMIDDTCARHLGLPSPLELLDDRERLAGIHHVAVRHGHLYDLPLPGGHDVVLHLHGL